MNGNKINYESTPKSREDNLDDILFVQKNPYNRIIALAIAYNVNINSNSELTSLVLANIEALADESSAKAGDPCYKGSYNRLLPEATKCAQPCSKERCGGLTDNCY